MFKKVLSIFLCVVMGVAIVGTSASAAATEEMEGTIVPYYTYLDTIVPTLSISAGSATVSGNIRGYSNVTKISYAVTLQVYSGNSWTDVKNWSGYANANRTTYSYSSNSVYSGKTYRTKTVATIYSGTNSESVTAYSTEKTA